MGENRPRAALHRDLLMGSSGPQGIVEAIGIVSASHLEEVWAVLEPLGCTRFLRSASMSPGSQVGGPRGRRQAD